VLGFEIYSRLLVDRRMSVLTRLVECHNQLTHLRTDNGSQVSNTRLTEWCETQGVVPHWVQPNKVDSRCLSRTLQQLISLVPHQFRSPVHVYHFVED
jgi:hypothetical protein